MGLTNEQYNRIMREYEAIQDENLREMHRRKEEIDRLLPEYESIAQSSASLALQKLKARLEQGSIEPDTSFQDIAFKKRALLRNAGFTETYLDPIYQCKDCHDTGYLFGRTTQDGQAFAKTKCHCFIKREIALLYENSNMDNSLLSSHFRDISYDYRDGEDLRHLKSAVMQAHSFVDNFDTEYQNFYLMGTVGTGKSFLSGCIANALIEKGNSVMYFSSIGFFDLLSRYSFGQKNKEALYNYCKNLYNYDLVIIDDLGTEMTNSFVSSQLFDFINERHLRQKSTLISSNLSFEELRDRYSDRIFSRITANYIICRLTGPDYRLISNGIR